jgi:hypothetical protein
VWLGNLGLFLLKKKKNKKEKEKSNLNCGHGKKKKKKKRSTKLLMFHSITRVNILLIFLKKNKC